MNPNQKYLEANQKLWNTRTGIHVKSDFYNLPAFMKGETSLRNIELEELGSVEGKSLLHLQCHFGQDTLSFSRMGANATGLDFSEEALNAGRNLAKELGLDTQFVQSDVLNIGNKLNRQYDIVFTSYGVLGWLPDLTAWAASVSRHLKAGGTFYIVEFHPFYNVLNEKGEFHYNYFFSTTPDLDIAEHTYTDGEKHEKLDEYWWNHSLSDVINALLGEGLEMEFMHEYPYLTYKLAKDMLEIEPGRWVFPHLKESIPYIFSMKWKKPQA